MISSVLLKIMSGAQVACQVAAADGQSSTRNSSSDCQFALPLSIPVRTRPALETVVFAEDNTKTVVVHPLRRLSKLRDTSRMCRATSVSHSFGESSPSSPSSCTFPEDVSSNHAGEAIAISGIDKGLCSLVAIRDIERMKSERVCDLKNRRLEDVPPGAIPDDATEVNLRRNLLTALPSDVLRLVCIRTLHLSCNRFASFPEEICLMTTLECLYMSDNGLVELPSSIGRLRNLTVLRLCRNNLRGLPEEIGNLTKLTTLALGSIYGGNVIASLPASIGRLASLVEMDVSNNMLVELPREIGYLPSLRILNASCNSIASLPASIGDLSALHSLNLRQNCLRILPAEIGRLSNLAILDVVDNRLVLVPGELRSLKRHAALLMHGNPFVDWENADSGARDIQEHIDTGTRAPSTPAGDGLDLPASHGRLGSIADKLDLSACSSVPRQQAMGLLELAGRAVVRSGIDFESAAIPVELKVHLRRARECDQCGRPYIELCHKYVERRSILGHTHVPSVLSRCSVTCCATKCDATAKSLSW
eukprot:Opistho-2@66817